MRNPRVVTVGGKIPVTQLQYASIHHQTNESSFKQLTVMKHAQNYNCV